MQKYIGAMVRKVIRVVLVAENDSLEVDSEILDSKIIKNQRKTNGKSFLIMSILDLFL